MVMSWILNSILKEIVDAFLYVSYSQELWNELKDRYGEYNGPQLYQLQREVSSIAQGGMNLSQYFTRLKKFWDKLGCLVSVPTCSCNCNCGAAKKLIEITEANHLMQFLMGLNDG